MTVELIFCKNRDKFVVILADATHFVGDAVLLSGAARYKEFYTIKRERDCSCLFDEIRN
jgi:hypothetical protein